MRALSLFLALLWCASPRVAFGEQALAETTDAKGEARRYFQAGVSLQKTDDFEAASEAYATSLELYPTKSALFNLANCQRAMHRYADAWHSLHRLQEQFGAELEEPMLSTSKAQLEELANLTGLVTVETQPVGATISLDGKPAGNTPLSQPLRVAIGQHVVAVSLEGHASKESNFKLSPRQSLTLALELAAVPSDVQPAPELKPVAAPEPPKLEPPTTKPAQPASTANSSARPSESRIVWTTVGWVGIALGGVAMGAGARSGILALGVDSDLDGVCEDGHCSEKYSRSVDRLDRLTTSANVFVGVGAALLATGVTLVLWPASNTETDTVTVTLGPAALRVGGRF